MRDYRKQAVRILGALGVIVLFVVVLYFAFLQIPHAVRPTLHPATSTASTQTP